MKYLKMTVDFRDDTTKVFVCVDMPHISAPWVTLYLKDFKREVLHSEGIKGMRYEIMEEKQK